MGDVMTKRYHVRLDFDIEVSQDLLTVAGWVGLPLVESGLNCLIDDRGVPPLKLYDVYRTVTLVDKVKRSRKKASEVKRER